MTCRMVIGADGARSNVAEAEVRGGDKISYVIANHEIIEAPTAPTEHYNPARCDVIYDGKISPGFYGWVFPHGKSASVGMGTCIEGVGLKKATADLREATGLTDCKTIRREGAPIPLKPLSRWDNGNDVLLVGGAAGVVALSSSEGIYYAMACGTCHGAPLAHEHAIQPQTKSQDVHGRAWAGFPRSGSHAERLLSI